MSRTIVGLNDPKAVKKYSAFLAVDTAVKSYWDSTMTGVGENAHTPVQMLTDLSKQRGDSITFDLVMQLRQMYTEGDDTMAGNSRWCLALAEWQSQFAHWIAPPTPLMMNCMTPR